MFTILAKVNDMLSITDKYFQASAYCFVLVAVLNISEIHFSL